MATRQGFLRYLLIFGSKLPWRVAVFSAVSHSPVFHIVAVQTSSPATGTSLTDLGGVIQQAFSRSCCHLSVRGADRSSVWRQRWLRQTIARKVVDHRRSAFGGYL
jgi:hypothetical protein